MLSIAKIHSESKQARGRSAAGYLIYLGREAPRELGFEAYAQGKGDGPAPFWSCGGPALLGLGKDAETEHIGKLARGFHPITGAPLVKGAGPAHVMGLDMTLSAPKDFSAVFAGADDALREELLVALRESTKTALLYAESASITRHGKGGAEKHAAEAAAAACFTHFASRALDPQLHVHALFMNVGKRAGTQEWSALEHRPLFDRKLAIGALWRAELAHRLGRLGFEVVPDGPYFKLRGVDDVQREALSTRSREISERARASGSDGALSRQAAALATRHSKAEPPLPELLARFRSMAAKLGLTPESVAAMRGPYPTPTPFAIDRSALLSELTAQQSVSTAHEALALICEKAMGRWSAAECLAELGAFMRFDQLVPLGRTELMTELFTSRSTLDLERTVSDRVEAAKLNHSHRVAPALVGAEFDRLETELRSKLGVEVSLSQQRDAAMHVACETGATAFVEGWAGSGKTTMLRAAARAWHAAGFEVRGCCQSAAASQNLAREADIPSRTIASLLLAARSGRLALNAKTVLVLDEAGTVGSAEFALLQEAATAAGAKLVCVGDAKQLQPIDAGGIFASLARIHGKAEVSDIRRQRTDFEPLLRWLEGRAGESAPLNALKAAELRRLPEDARMPALESICAQDDKLSRAFRRWRDRFDYGWMREAVARFAQGEATEALGLLDAKGRLRLATSRDGAIGELISAWAKDRTAIGQKIIVAATRADVAELNALARASQVKAGLVDDALGLDIEIKRRDDSTDIRRFAPGDRIGFAMNDRKIGIANGVAGTVSAIEARSSGPELRVELDETNARGERTVLVPVAFAMFDHAYATTNHRAQGLTRDSAHVLANAAMCDREWIYVAASRSRFATTIYADASSLAVIDPESHRADEPGADGRERAINALASRMKRSRAKGTSLDFEEADISLQSAALVSDISRADTDISRPSLISALAARSRGFAERLACRLRSHARGVSGPAAEPPQLER